jgi:hypothetical protein
VTRPEFRGRLLELLDELAATDTGEAIGAGVAWWRRARGETRDA